ncbi:MAG: hypothetical protein SFY32_09345 [Bacteroidota bacterium]|nr:hypothetical protein [Bacteroidota bacterium]
MRTLRERLRSDYNYNKQGDIYRCVKDSNLMAVRLLMDFLGIKGQINNGHYFLISRSSIHNNDVRIDKFIGRLLLPIDVPLSDAQTIAGVYVRADKELAHLTTIFNDEFNEESKLIEAATIIEGLLKVHLYDYFGESLPEMDR